MSLNQSHAHFLALYRDTLLDDIIPFWMKHGIDRKNGGIWTCLDRDGSLVDDDKSVWFQGRAGWMFATLYNEVEMREDWLEIARSCVDFIENYCIDTDGRLYFHVTTDGRPIRKRRYVYSESFASIAHAALYRATGELKHKQRATELFQIYLDWSFNPGVMPAKFTQSRPMIGLAPRMIAIATAQELRKNLITTEFDGLIDQCINEIELKFMHPDLEAVLEQVSPDGQFVNHADGRLINPGHALECAWFILDESRVRGGVPRLNEIGLKITDWMWRWGWDEQHGGIIYFRDALNRPVQEYWHDMKFWWPQNEAIIATLLAYSISGQAKYAEWHRSASEWAFRHFSDPEFGEWYGYLHRDGRVSQPCKGTLWKGPFHLPRMLLKCWQILEHLPNKT
jgi:N-acylglucosamine 2-epimerase